MRIINFKAFCQYENENYENVTGWVYFNPQQFDNGLFLWPISDDIKHIDEYLSPLLQFTGLYDKNGKEIYEGDYLSIGPFDLGCITNREGEIVKYEVKVDWCDYILYRKDLNLNWGRLSRLNEMGLDCQIIGNIHEPINQTP